MKKKIIYGCDSRGDGDSPYLTRWSLVACKLFAVYLHRFHRSDADEHHDHPWGFVSLILWRGYFEETVCPECDGSGRRYFSIDFQMYVGDCLVCKGSGSVQKRKFPGAILFRKATHRHRVVLVEGREAWSLIIRGPFCREWGFFTKHGWQNWRDYFKARGCK